MEDPSPEGAAEGTAESKKKSGASQAGLFSSLRGLLATLVATASTRLELLQVELEEEKLRLVGIGVLAVAASFFLALAVLVFTFFVILLFWDTHRLMVTGLVALVYLIVGLCCAAAARQRARAKSTMFAASLAQLNVDRQRLTQPE